MQITVKIDVDDKQLLMKECKKKFLKFHPEMEKVPLSTPKMLHEVIKWYLGN